MTIRSKKLWGYGSLGPSWLRLCARGGQCIVCSAPTDNNEYTNTLPDNGLSERFRVVAHGRSDFLRGN